MELFIISDFIMFLKGGGGEEMYNYLVMDLS